MLSTAREMSVDRLEVATGGHEPDLAVVGILVQRQTMLSDNRCQISRVDDE